MEQALREALPAVRELRDEGVVGAIGAGMNFPEPLTRIAREGVDCILMAGRYTLLDRSGAGLLDQCASLGVDVFAAGVFNSGILAGGTTFNYAPAPPELLDRGDGVRRMLAPRRLGDRGGAAVPAHASRRQARALRRAARTSCAPTSSPSRPGSPLNR